MARPKTEKLLHKNVPVKSYWSDAEYAWLQARADAVGLSVSAYIRSRILEARPDHGREFARAA